ncbi:MAG TPA: hypothetical protein VG032_08100, partial [Acidimicrobiales bacterium]|nr:hypothetical protein [Acidimicrobiales bacterium]
MTHPLEPLTADEIRTSVRMVRNSGRIDDAARFATVTLDDPPKAQLASFRPGDPVERRVRLVIVPGPEAAVVEAVVSLPTAEIVSWVERSDVRPALLFEDSMHAINALKADPTWQQ